MKTQEIKTINLFEKIQLVSNMVRNIEKGITIGSGSYSYKAVSDLDVTLAVKDAEKVFRIISIPTKQELVNSEIVRIIKKDGSEGLTFVDTVKLTLVIYDLDDIKSFIEIESYGKGIDNGDKGFGKASTYARKYALLNVYKIATGEDPDASKNDDIKTPETPNEKMAAIKNYLDSNLDTLQRLLEHFSIGSIDDLTSKQIDTVYTTYKQKKLI